MSKTLQRICAIVLLIVMLATGLSYLDQLTIRKFPISKYSDFMENPKDYDILFLGSSHAMMGFQPMELWAEYGYTSYNMGSSACTIPTSYWLLVNALDYADPELVVLDLFFLQRQKKVEPGAAFSVHEAIDWLPMSLNKLRAIADLGIGTGHDEYILEYLIPFSIYHSRWSQLEKDDFYPQVVPSNGARVGFSVSQPLDCEYTEEKRYLPSDLPGVEYAKKIIDLCHSRDIEVLLTFLPYPAPEEDVQLANSAEDYAEQWGVEYINFFKTDTIDFYTDMADEDSHLNVSGGRKITEYVGNFIHEHFSLTDHREDEDYTWMHQRFAQYREYELNNIFDRDYLHNIMAPLSNRSWACLVYLEQDCSIYDNETMLRSIGNIACQAGPQLLEEAAATGQAYVMFVNNSSGQLLEYLGDDIPNAVETDLGSLSAQSDSEIKLMLFDAVSGNALVEYHFSDQGDGFFKRDF